MGHPEAFKLANDVVGWLPEGLSHVFFTNSGSESVDTALKIALAYHRARGEGTRTRLIGRERGYHGVGFGGISVGGMVNNRKWFGTGLPGVDHLPHTHDLAKNAYTRGEPEHGANLADELERLVALHDASTIAAVIVEPVAGSTGVLIPPKGYLKRLRELCSKHGILLIFDEVITGFGRLGAPFGSQFFGVTPDMITMAKGLTNGAVPMGAVAASRQIYDTFMQGPEGAIELFHGYTYSAHPVACAAGVATQEIYRRDGLLTRAAEVADYWADGVHSLRGLPHVIDLRNLGLIGAIELDPIPGKPGARGFQTFVRAFEKGLLVRVTGDIIALSPPLIIEKSHIDQVFGTLAETLRELA
jgi:beta-alanine--pyruvate transaminase